MALDRWVRKVAFGFIPGTQNFYLPSFLFGRKVLIR